jgi:cysteine desulfurase
LRPVSVQVRRLMTKEEQEQFDRLWEIGKFLEQHHHFEYAHTIQTQLDRLAEEAVERMLRYEHRPNNKGMTAVNPEQAQVYVPQVKRIYLDYAATTPLRPEVREAMVQAFEKLFANPSSSHISGRMARNRMEEAREEIASLLGAKPSELIFTSGGTEADNMAIMGPERLRTSPRKPLLLTSNLEHHAVLDTCRYMQEQYGWELAFLGHDRYGCVTLEDVQDQIRRYLADGSGATPPVLVSVMLANNEIGTLQPVSEIADICKTHNVLMHTDAVQAVGKIPIHFDRLGVDLLSLTAHKVYGPKGIGALLIREGVRMLPILHGGGQERSLRPGTEHVAGIIGLQVALRYAIQELETERVRLQTLRDRLIQQLLGIPDARLNGHPELRLPNHVHISFRGVNAKTLLEKLDSLGLEVSAGAACDAGETRISYVLQAIGLEPEWAMGSIRLTLGKETTDQDVFLAGKKIKQAVSELRGVE